jgi:hypothetical protein
MKGNVNHQMGAMHKELMANRLNDHSDPLTLEVIQTLCPEAVTVTSSLILTEAERPSEMGLMWEAKDINGKQYSGKCDVSAKGCTGFGSSNQLSRFWLNEALTPEELLTPAGHALLAIAGTEGLSKPIEKALTPGQLSTGINSKNLGRPLMVWLGDEKNTQKILQKGFGETDSPKVLLLTMRSAGEHGEDIHIAVESKALLEAAVKEAILTTTKGEKYVPIMPADDTLDFSRAISLKRKGGDAGADTANNLQLVLRTKGLLEMALENKNGVKTLNAKVSYEIPSLTSQAIFNLAGRDQTEEEAPKSKQVFWKKLEQQANYISPVTDKTQRKYK